MPINNNGFKGSLRLVMMIGSASLVVLGLFKGILMGIDFVDTTNTKNRKIDIIENQFDTLYIEKASEQTEVTIMVRRMLQELVPEKANEIMDEAKRQAEETKKMMEKQKELRNERK